MGGTIASVFLSTMYVYMYIRISLKTGGIA